MAASNAPPQVDVKPMRKAKKPQLRVVAHPVAQLPTKPWVVRELQAEEWGRLSELPQEVFASFHPDPAIFRAIVVEEAGRLIACWFAYNAAHVEPVWIHPDHRKRPGVVRQLWGKMIGMLQEHDVPIAFCTIADDAVMQSLPQALRMGFTRIPAMCYYLDLSSVAFKEHAAKVTRTDPEPEEQA